MSTIRILAYHVAPAIGVLVFPAVFAWLYAEGLIRSITCRTR